MKNLTPIILLLLCSFLLHAQPEVERWGCYEAAFESSVKGNPFDVQFTATFTNGSAKVTVNGFYDGSDTFRIRFMPQTEGRWTYVTSSRIPALNNKKGSFMCTPPTEGNHGPVAVDGTGFKYADGTRYYPVGTTSYDWMHMPGDYPERTLSSLKESGFNKLRMLFFLQNVSVDTPWCYPFVKNEGGGWDFQRFDPEYFQYVESRLKALMNIGVEADLILFHPYDGGVWGFDRMPLEVNLRYLKYITARYSAFRNIWWSLANEFDGMKNIPAVDWDKFARQVRAGDPYGHLLSIHGYTATYYNYWLPEYSHASIQDQAPVSGPGRASTVMNIYKKPVIFDEVCYEGNMSSRWGCLSGEEELFRMYNGLMCGTYVTHAECLNLDSSVSKNEEKTNFLAFGGEFHGECWKRIKFLRSILEDLPNPPGLADSSWDPYTTTAGDGYYLIYLGKSMPEEWIFDLPAKNASYARPAAGEHFKVEILDTWNMTVAVCPVDFETAAPSGYRIKDVKGRSVRLPERPYLMLRIKRI